MLFNDALHVGESAPPFSPAQTHDHGPAPETAGALPALHRPAVLTSAALLYVPDVLAGPQLPSTGHGSVLQFCVVIGGSVSRQFESATVAVSSGLRHSFIEVCVPPPHVAEQAPKDMLQKQSGRSQLCVVGGMV